MLQQSVMTAALAVALMFSIPIKAANKALLIGIGEYPGEKLDLQGPPHDVSSLALMLKQNWGFNDIRTLTQYDASRTNILAALEKITQEATPDDTIFIYYSGHGTSDHDRGLKLPLPFSSGALIPQDFPINGSDTDKLNALIIGKRDIRPMLSKLDQTGAHTLVIFDSCYSGEAVRGGQQANALPTRNADIGLSSKPNYDDDEATRFDMGLQADKAEPYPYTHIFFMSAANAREKALDISQSYLLNHPTYDNKPHGAFTDALLRTLKGEELQDSNHDGLINYQELHQSVQTFMQTRVYSHDPQALPQLSEDHHLLRLQTIFNKKQKIKIPSSSRQLPSRLLSVYVNPQEIELISRLRQIPEISLSDVPSELNVHRQGSQVRLENQAHDSIAELTSPNLQQIVGRIRQEAWKKQFDQQLQQRAAFALDMSLDDSSKGRTAIENEKIAVTVRSEKENYLVLLDIDSSGTLSILYPYFSHELQAIPAHKAINIPSDNPDFKIKIQAPFGTDHMVAIGFTQKPDFLDAFIGKSQLLPESDLYQKLMRQLASAEYGFNTLDVLTVKAQ